MPWTLEFSDDGKTLKVVFTGTLPAAELHSSTVEILGAMLAHKITRVLLDCRDAHMETPIIGVYRLPDLYEAHGIPRQTRAAVVLPRDSYRLEIYEFYEDVCLNRGYFVKLFEDADTAWAWLMAA